jgi:hypothetical protein
MFPFPGVKEFVVKEFVVKEFVVNPVVPQRISYVTSVKKRPTRVSKETELSVKRDLVVKNPVVSQRIPNVLPLQLLPHSLPTNLRQHFKSKCQKRLLRANVKRDLVEE